MKELRERLKTTYSLMEYSQKRIDLLIISISGAGIYVCLETIKFLRGGFHDDSIWVKFSGGLFLAAIVVNFVSQFLGYHANRKDYEWTEKRIKVKDKPNKEEKKEIKDLDDEAERYSNYTNNSNIASAVLMIFGLLLIMVYFSFIF